MGYRYRGPQINIFGLRFHKNKKGWSISSKGLLGQRKTYNTATGKTTITYKTGKPGLSYQTVKGGKKDSTRIPFLNKKRKLSLNNENPKFTNEEKEFIVTLLTGIFGGHKFMKGQVWLGFLYLFTFGIFGIGWLKDSIKLALKIKKLNEKNPNKIS